MKYKKEIKSIYEKTKKNTLHNIEMLSKIRNDTIKFYEEWSSMVSEAKHKATKETRIKILTPKQMLQRLPIV